MKNFIIGFLICFILMGGRITFVVTSANSLKPTSELMIFFLLIAVSFIATFTFANNKMQLLREMYPKENDKELYSQALFEALPIGIFSLFVAFAFPYAFYCVRTHQDIFSIQTMQSVTEKFFQLIF